MSEEKAKQAALRVASESKAKKRKVGCAILLVGGGVITGCNYHPEGLNCENDVGETVPEVIHAEVSALNTYIIEAQHKEAVEAIYVTHPPCKACQRAIRAQLGDTEIHVVEEFMKFDTAKLRYDLIPPSSTKALAEVLTYGAKKYKPNNYLNCQDHRQFIAALFRHLEAWRGGEEADSESKLPHLSHMLTNVAILIALSDKESKDAKSL